MISSRQFEADEAREPFKTIKVLVWSGWVYQKRNSIYNYTYHIYAYTLTLKLKFANKPGAKHTETTR